MLCQFRLWRVNSDGALAAATTQVSGGAGGQIVAAQLPEPAVEPASHKTSRVCSWVECGQQLAGGAAEAKQCSQCKRAWYWSRTCQKRDWKQGGHKQACTEPPCCTICLDGGDDPLPIQCGCGCRGEAGLAHVACKVEFNARKNNGYHKGWGICPTCGQGCTGAMHLALAREVSRRLRHRPQHDRERLCAEHSLGDALRAAGVCSEAEPLQARVLAAMKRSLGAEHALTLAAACGLATTYSAHKKIRRGREGAAAAAGCTNAVAGR